MKQQIKSVNNEPKEGVRKLKLEEREDIKGEGGYKGVERAEGEGEG